MCRQQGETEMPREGSVERCQAAAGAATALCLRCRRAHLSMPNKTDLQLPRGRWTLSVSYVLPAAINYSHLQDVKSCDSTKEIETKEHQLFYLFMYLFIYFAPQTIDIPPSHQLYIDEFYHLCF